jgi:hypothetical protein
MHRPVSGYGEVSIRKTPDGPEFVGEVPAHIGVSTAMLAEILECPTTWARYRKADGTLTLIDLKFRHIGVDGPDVFVFERIPQ